MSTKIEQLIKAEVSDTTKKAVAEILDTAAKAKEAIRQRTIDMLIGMREWRFLYIGQEYNDEREKFKDRSVESLFDSVEDEMGQIARKEKPDA